MAKAIQQRKLTIIINKTNITSGRIANALPRHSLVK